MVSTVEIEFGSGRIVQQALRMLTSDQARKAHLPQFRYLAMALSEDACISRLTGFDSEGSLILDFDTREC